MRSAPLCLEVLDLGVGETAWLELTPSSQAAHVAECEIAGFAHVPLGAVLAVGARWNTKNFASGYAIWLITRIAGGVETPVAIDLPIFTGNAGEYPTFNA
jgi:hypothetical protein